MNERLSDETQRQPLTKIHGGTWEKWTSPKNKTKPWIGIEPEDDLICIITDNVAKDMKKKNRWKNTDDEININ